MGEYEHGGKYMSGQPPGVRTTTRKRRSDTGQLSVVGTSEPIGEPEQPELPTDDDVQRHPSTTSKQPGERLQNGHPSLGDEDEYYRLVFFGDPGKGKTSHAAALAKLGRVIFINSERGLKARPLARLGVPIDNIEPRPSKAERDAGIEVTYKWLEALAYEVQDRLLAGEGIVGVVWDTGNDMYQRMLMSIVDKNADGRDNEFAAEIGDYGDVSQAMRRMIRRYHSLDCHWIVTFHAVRTKDEEGGLVVVPNLSDKLLVDMLGYVDAVIYCMAEDPDDSGDEEFTGFCRPVGKFQAKDRYHVLPKRMAMPTADRVIAYLSEELTSTTDKVQQEAKDRALARLAPK